MSKLFLYDRSTNEYLCINITNQTSTGWHRDIRHVEDLANTTTRSVDIHFYTFANMSLAEAVRTAEDSRFTIHRIEDDAPTAYEYW